MRLDLYGVATTDATKQVSTVDLGKTPTGKHPVNAKGSSIEDKTTLSSGTDSVQTLKTTALQTSPTRQARVEALKQAVNQAQYQLDSVKIAAALSASDL